MDIDHSITVNAPAEPTFQFVSDPENLRQYMPGVDEVRVDERGHVRLKGDAGRPFESEGVLRVLAPEHRMEWHSAGGRDYRGDLFVEGDRETCTVRVHLHIAGPQPDDREAGQIHHYVRHTLESIQHLVEGKGRKIEHDTYGAAHTGHEPVHHR
ncbi:MAG: SRPBCC family protein [Acidobacteria bacterium]|nr:SRPBCC family protein [Acidobacteriota bacterium]